MADDPVRTIQRATEVRRAVDAVAAANRDLLAAELSQRVDELMRAQGIHGDDVALRGGPSENTIANILKARGTRISTLCQLAAALGCTVQITFTPIAPEQQRDAVA